MDCKRWWWTSMADNAASVDRELEVNEAGGRKGSSPCEPLDSVQESGHEPGIRQGRVSSWRVVAATLATSGSSSPDHQSYVITIPVPNINFDCTCSTNCNSFNIHITKKNTNNTLKKLAERDALLGVFSCYLQFFFREASMAKGWYMDLAGLSQDICQEYMAVHLEAIWSSHAVCLLYFILFYLIK